MFQLSVFGAHILLSDVLIVLVKELLAHSDIRIVLMSATLDASLFSRYFNHCPALEIPGRTFPVKGEVFCNL